MKKLLCALLAMITIMSLCACGKEENNDIGGNSLTETNTVLSEPTEEEQRAIRDYCAIVDVLNEYAETGKIRVFDKNGDKITNVQKALAYCYERLLELEGVEKWAGTEWASDETVNWNRQEVLDSIKVIEDVRLKEVRYNYDFVGNSNSGNVISIWEYNENGMVEYFYSEECYAIINFTTTPINYGAYSGNVLWDPAKMGTYTYDASNRVVQLDKIDENGHIKATGIPTYDEDGNLTNVHITYWDGRTEEVDYFYDDQNRVEKIVYIEDNDRSEDIYHRYFTYQYDENNNIIKHESWKEYDDIKFDGTVYHNIVSKIAVDYSYDNNGWLSSAVLTEEKINNDTQGAGVEKRGVVEAVIENHLEYTCDEKGNIETITIVWGDMIDTGEMDPSSAGEVMETPRNPKTVIEVTNGDYYVYKPAM